MNVSTWNYVSYAAPHQQYDNMLDWLSEDCIQQVNNI